VLLRLRSSAAHPSPDAGASRLGGEPAGMRNRVAWGLAAMLAVGVLGGVSFLGVRLRPLIVAKYRGHNADLRGAMLRFAPLAGVDLDCANLRGAKLAGANLGGADLHWSSFGNANLSGANLAGANLRAASGSSADLPGADLHGADLTHAFLDRANLSGADLSGANLTNTIFDGANLSGANLSGANLTRTRFALANLQGANLRHADLRSTDLLGASTAPATRLGRAVWEPANLTGARYDRLTRWPKGFDPLKHGAILIP